MKVKVIGVGGIGSHLLLPLIQYVNFPSNTDKKVDEVLLIDGDKFEEKNQTRQFVPEIGEYKAKSTVDYFKDKFPDLNIGYANTYINERNIREFIKEKDIILLCVDNDSTRKIISDHIQTLDNIILITGGNEYTEGDAQLIMRYEGINITPSLTELHPEINEPTDRNPSDMSCEELAESGQPQLSIVNAGVADVMRRMFMGILSDGIGYHETFINFKNGNIRNVFPEEKQLLKYVW